LWPDKGDGAGNGPILGKLNWVHSWFYITSSL
jgi:hypothetical protein